MGAKKNEKKKKSDKREIYETIRIGKMAYSLKYTSSLPLMQEQVFDELVADIRQRGIMVPVLIDESANVIDGAHRIRAAHLLGLKSVPTIIASGLSEDEKWDLAQDLNLHRRQLTPQQIRKIVSENKRAVPILALKLREEGKSLRQISEELGVSHECIRQKIEEANVNELTVDLPDTVVGKDGKKRKAKAKPKFCPTIYATTSNETQRAIQACQAAGDKLPNRGISIKRAEQAARQKAKEDLRSNDYEDFKQGQATLLLGDFREKCQEIGDSSVDVIFTDPPYSKESLPLWTDLARFANRVLKPSGLLVSYSGNMYLPDVYRMLAEHLEYLWTAAALHSGCTKLVRPSQMIQGWKPIIIFYKPPLDKYWRPFTDVFSGGQAKEHHRWEQPVDEALYYIRALCPRNGLVVDPMSGSSTTIIAALQSGLGLRSIGIEIDKAAFAVAENRVKETIERLQARRDSA